MIGIPAFRIPGLLRRCLNALVDTPAVPGWERPTILVVDNHSDPDVKALLRDEFDDRVQIVRNLYNEYCNRAWNQTMKRGLHLGYDLIGLGSSDAVLHPGWYDLVTQRVEQFDKEVLVPTVGEPVTNPSHLNVEHATGGVAGFFSFLPRAAVELVYPIPATLRHWFGDQYMFTKLRDHRWSVTLMQDLRAFHEQSAVTAATPEASAVIEADKIEWLKLEAEKLEAEK